MKYYITLQSKGDQDTYFTTIDADSKEKALNQLMEEVLTFSKYYKNLYLWDEEHDENQQEIMYRYFDNKDFSNIQGDSSFIKVDNHYFHKDYLTISADKPITPSNEIPIEIMVSEGYTDYFMSIDGDEVGDNLYEHFSDKEVESIIDRLFAKIKSKLLNNPKELNGFLWENVVNYSDEKVTFAREFAEESDPTHFYKISI